MLRRIYEERLINIFLKMYTHTSQFQYVEYLFPLMVGMLYESLNPLFARLNRSNPHVAAINSSFSAAGAFAMNQ